MAPPVSGPSETDFEQSLDNDSDQQLYLTHKSILQRAKELIAKAKEHFEESSPTAPALLLCHDSAQRSIPALSPA
eukprot:3938754-Rhodomonas_salina.1